MVITANSHYYLILKIVILGNTCRVKNITCSEFGQCINDDSQEEGYVCYCEAGHVGDDCEIGKKSKS